jgi:hypothetical protein
MYLGVFFSNQWCNSCVIFPLLMLCTFKTYVKKCCNPSFGLTIKARACKGASQMWSPGVTFHAPGSVRKCEGMNPHTPKWAPTLGVRVPMDSQIFWERLQGSKPIGLRSSLYHWKNLGTYMSKMGSHDPFEHLKHEWPKEGSGVKLPIWLPTTKSQELPQFPCVKEACNIPLKSFRWGLQLFFRLHLNQRSSDKVMGPQIYGSPNCENFRTPTWESWDKMTFEC